MPAQGPGITVDSDLLPPVPGRLFYLQEENMPHVLVGLQVMPGVAPDKEKVYPIVDRAIALIKASGLKHQVCPLETVIEGEADTIWALIKTIQQTCIDAGASSVICQIKLHYRPEGVHIDELMAHYR